MADPRTLHLDGPTLPWRDVPEVVRCGACFGALPPDTTAACKYCGEGTPPGLTVLRPLVAPAAGRTGWAHFPNPAPGDPPLSPWQDITEQVAAEGPPMLVEGLSERITPTTWEIRMPTGPPDFPVPPLSEPLHVHGGWRPRRRPWWRRIWRRRG